MYAEIGVPGGSADRHKKNVQSPHRQRFSPTIDFPSIVNVKMNDVSDDWLDKARHGR